jgi:hypothetical protein
MKKICCRVAETFSGPKTAPKTHARTQNSRRHQTPRAEQKISRSSRPRPGTPRRCQYSNPSPVHRLHAAAPRLHAAATSLRAAWTGARALPTAANLHAAAPRLHAARVQTPRRRHLPACRLDRSSGADCKGARAALHRSSVADCKGARAALHRSSGAASLRAPVQELGRRQPLQAKATPSCPSSSRSEFPKSVPYSALPLLLDITSAVQQFCEVIHHLLIFFFKYLYVVRFSYTDLDVCCSVVRVVDTAVSHLIVTDTELQVNYLPFISGHFDFFL